MNSLNQNGASRRIDRNLPNQKDLPENSTL